MELTIEDLRREAHKTEVGRLHFSLLIWKFKRPSYEEWVKLVEDAVYYQVIQMAGRRNDFNDLDEDALTAIIQISLDNLNLDVSAKVVNGNTDISVEFDTYKWLGEAKIASDASKIYHGYQQLTSRYATGIKNQSSGGLLLYCQHDAADVILSGWRAALEIQVPSCNARKGMQPLSFRSDDVCQSTGLGLEILHFAIPLHHKPQEDEVKLSETAIKAARKARTDTRLLKHKKAVD